MMPADRPPTLRLVVGTIAHGEAEWVVLPGLVKSSLK